MNETSKSRIKVYLDDQAEPISVYRPPARFQLDTTSLEDGPHVLRVVATDESGKNGVRTIPFEVRNGPGIAVEGLSDHDVVEGKINLTVNAYGGAYAEKWEPSQAETPAPVPTWMWLIVIFLAAWAVYYGVQQWNPTAEYTDTPTYGKNAFQAGEQTTPAQQFEESAGQMGARLYRTSCASCHQSNGQGVPGAFPPLAGDPVVTARDPTRHIQIVLFGMQGKTIGGTGYASQMPAWVNQLSDREVAAVINHERTSWGNNAPTVTPEDVTTIRQQGPPQ